VASIIPNTDRAFINARALKEGNHLILHRDKCGEGCLCVRVTDCFGRHCGYISTNHEHLIATDIDQDIMWHARVTHEMFSFAVGMLLYTMDELA
jgi:hypothetical protein